MKPKIVVLNGSNLNMLGVREPQIYGRDTLADIDKRLQALAPTLGLEVELRQSNNEGDLVTWIQQARSAAAGIVINPAAFTHTSIAVLDALLLSDLPVIELHLSNPHKREEFRDWSYASRTAKGIICGFGAHGYELALMAMAKLVKDEAAKKPAAGKA
jgi:3-dehydroquinate dehydratase-2